MNPSVPLVSRRGLLVASGLGLAFSPLLSGCGGGSGQRLISPRTFHTPLPIPPLADSMTEEGSRRFALTAAPGRSELRPGIETETWGYNGPYLGPTLRARVGEHVHVTVTNKLTETTTVHWHGMHLPAEYDGGPHQPVDPGEQWQAEWVINQPPATLWYHPHPHGETEEHVTRGLAGMFWLDPADGPDERLPHRYGIDDIPLVVQDKKVADDGGLVFDDGGNEIGLLGDLVLTNGVTGAHLTVDAELTRLRILNGSTARSYLLGFDDDRAFHQIGTDGGLMAGPVECRRVPLSPGERAEIVVRLSPGERVRLRTFGAALGDVVSNAAFGGEDTADLLELRARKTLSPSPALPAELAAIAWLDASRAVQERRFTLEDRAINGREMDMERIDATVEVDTIEVWEVYNRNLFPHNFHVHDVQFQVLSVDGGEPAPHLRGWKDTVYLEPRRTYRLAMEFADYADPTAPYMFHCHLLLHEDEGMMGQFVVVNPGETAVLPQSDHQHG